MRAVCSVCNSPVNLLANDRIVRTCGCPEDTAVVVQLTAVLTGDSAIGQPVEPPAPPPPEGA